MGRTGLESSSTWRTSRGGGRRPEGHGLEAAGHRRHARLALRSNRTPAPLNQGPPRAGWEVPPGRSLCRTRFSRRSSSRTAWRSNSAPTLEFECIVRNREHFGDHLLTGMLVTRDTAGDHLVRNERCSFDDLDVVVCSDSPSTTRVVDRDAGGADSKDVGDPGREVSECRATGGAEVNRLHRSLLLGEKRAGDSGTLEHSEQDRGPPIPGDRHPVRRQPTSAQSWDRHFGGQVVGTRPASFCTPMNSRRPAPPVPDRAPHRS